MPPPLYVISPDFLSTSGLTFAIPIFSKFSGVQKYSNPVNLFVPDEWLISNLIFLGLAFLFFLANAVTIIPEAFKSKSSSSPVLSLAFVRYTIVDAEIKDWVKNVNKRAEIYKDIDLIIYEIK